MLRLWHLVWHWACVCVVLVRVVSGLSEPQTLSERTETLLQYQKGVCPY